MNPSATLPTPEDLTPKGSHDSLPIHETEPRPLPGTQTEGSERESFRRSRSPVAIHFAGYGSSSHCRKRIGSFANALRVSVRSSAKTFPYFFAFAARTGSSDFSANSSSFTASP